MRIIREAKRARRKAEKIGWKTKSQADFGHYKACRNRITYLLNSARIVFSKDFIADNSTDQVNVFRATRRILKHDTGNCLPLHDDKFQLANDVETFFVKKITLSCAKNSMTRPRRPFAVIPVNTTLPNQLENHFTSS